MVDAKADDTQTTPAKAKSGAAEAPAGQAKNQAPAGPPVPKVTVRTQYVKDLSFENPGAPKSFADAAGPPQIKVNVDVETKPLGGNHYEIALKINATAKQKAVTVFVTELSYAGLFALENIPKDRLETVCVVECPRLLFPFARRVIADATRDGGYPPLLLDPIDFRRLYRQHRTSAGASAA